MSTVQPRDFCKGFGEKCLQYFKFHTKMHLLHLLLFLRFCLHYFEIILQGEKQ